MLVERMSKKMSIHVQHVNVRILRDEFSFLVVDFRDRRIESLLVHEFRRLLDQGDAFVSCRTLRHHACCKDNTRHHCQRDHGYLPHRLPLSLLRFIARVHSIRSPAFSGISSSRPITSYCSIDRRRVSSALGDSRETGFLIDGRRISRTASHLAECQGGAAIASRDYRSKMYDESILSFEFCQTRVDITGCSQGGLRDRNVGILTRQRKLALMAVLL